jgi:hypothetical protein
MQRLRLIRARAAGVAGWWVTGIDRHEWRLPKKPRAQAAGMQRGAQGGAGRKDQAVLRRRDATRPSRPSAAKASVPGSGTAAGCSGEMNRKFHAGFS